MPFARDESHWLFRLSPREWIQAALTELRHAQEAYARHDARAGLAGARRAAGMALNGVLIVEPSEGWGRSYVDHVNALAEDATVPEPVRAACRVLQEATAPGGGVVPLRSRAADERIMEAARDVMAHALAVVTKHET